MLKLKGTSICKHTPVGDYMTLVEEQISELPILKVIIGGKVT